MDINKLISVITIILTLSVASERLVEIIKGFMPKTFGEKPPGATPPTDEDLSPDEAAAFIEKGERDEESWRKAKISMLAIACGMITAFLASPILASIFKDIFANSPCLPFSKFSTPVSEGSPCMVVSVNGALLTAAMGLLASGGSAMWNSILEYLLKVKDTKKAEAKRTDALGKIEVERARMELFAEKTKLQKPE